MKLQHTSGDWDYDYYGEHVSFFSPQHQDDYFMRIEFGACVDTSPWEGEGDPTEEIATVRLIAASPSLLDACLAVIGTCPCDEDDECFVCSTLKPAILKAIPDA